MPHVTRNMLNLKCFDLPAEITGRAREGKTGRKSVCVHVCYGSHVCLLFAVRVDEPTMHKVSQAEQKYCSIIFGANNTTEEEGGCTEKDGERGWYERGGLARDQADTWHISAHAFINHTLQLESAASQANRQPRKQPGAAIASCLPACVSECPVYVLSYSCAGYFKDIYTDSGFLMEKLL